MGWANWMRGGLLLAAFGCGGGRAELPPLIESSSRPDHQPRPVDVLFVVDNTASMAEKQRLLANAAAELLARLVNPLCVDPATGAATLPPDDPLAECPAGQVREFPAVRDLHVGVVTSSLGTRGADVCADPNKNDRAYLLGLFPRAAETRTHPAGFIHYAPDQQLDPPGAADTRDLVVRVGSQIVAAGVDGCGYESPLEAFYRFLIDPDPPERTVTAPCAPGSAMQCIEHVGVDEFMLRQRRAFLRPNSAVLVVVLSDENDCSLVETGQNYLVFASKLEDKRFYMPRATSVCAADPTHRCCHSCGQTPPAGCPAPADDLSCQKGNGYYTAVEDDPNLRCFDQKRRFGFDFLQPIERYARGLTAPTVSDRQGNEVSNELIAGPTDSPDDDRDPALVHLAVLAGAPWQLLKRANTVNLEYQDAEELVANGTWSKLVSDSPTPASDPHMLPSSRPRAGLPGPDSPPDADPVHGHEYETQASDLQYACISPLRQPLDCSGTNEVSCECRASQVELKKPLCQSSAGFDTLQRATQAYPTPRQLRLVQLLGSRGIATSICAASLDDARVDSGYRPLVGAVLERVAPTLYQVTR